MDPGLHPIPLESFTVALPVAIRRCVAGDLSALEWGGLFTHHREIIREAFERQARGEVVMLVADVNGFPAGQAWIDLARRREARTGFVWAVRTVPWLNGLGIGARLMQAAERVAAVSGCDAVEVGVETCNAGARRLYERLGYEVVSRLAERYRYTPPGGAPEEIALDEWILRKRLAPPACRDPAPGRIAGAVPEAGTLAPDPSDGGGPSAGGGLPGAVQGGAGP